MSGLLFTSDEWEEFKGYFDVIREYLCRFTISDSDKLLGQEIYGSGWKLKFGHNRRGTDKAIIIKENRTPLVVKQCEIKPYRTTIIMEKMSFLYLAEYIVKCVDIRLEYLKCVSGSVSCVAKEIVECIITNDFKSLPIIKAGKYTVVNVKDIINVNSVQWLDIIRINVEKRTKDMNNQIPLNDIIAVFYQSVSNHLDIIVNELNKRVYQ